MNDEQTLPRLDQAFAEFTLRGEEKVTPQTFFQILTEIEKERVQKTKECLLCPSPTKSP